MAQIETVLNQELTEPVVVHYIDGNVFSQDSYGNRISVNLFKDGNPYTITGSISGAVVRSDGETVPITGGTISSNKMSISLPAAAYEVPGVISVVMKLSETVSGLSTVTTVAAIVANVYRTTTDAVVDPGAVMPTIEMLINAIDEAVATIPVDYSNLSAGVAAISPLPHITWTLNKNIDASGNISDNNYTALSNLIPVESGDIIVRRMVEKDSNNKTLIMYVSQFNGDTFVSRTSLDFNEAIKVGSSTNGVYLSFGRASSSGATIQQSDISYFDAYMFRRAVNANEAFVYRGTISSLGYTSFGQCVKPGYYTFSSSDIANISDVPTGWTGGGGVIKVYKRTDSAEWQEIDNNLCHAIRYGTSGLWYNESGYIYAKYTNATGDDNSTEQLDIFIPRTTNPNLGTNYNMGHCVDNSAKSNVWRIVAAYRQDGTNTRKITIRGEWECALHLDGRSDFSGGVVHGDEVETGVVAFVDGVITPLSNIDSVCKELKIVRWSTLYDPNDDTTEIADHGVEYVYNSEGLTVNQSIKWKVSATLTACYLAMLPIAKAYSNYRYSNVDFTVTENPSSNYSVTIPNATSVTEYNDTYDIFFEMSISEYPTGLTGGDCALITDNGGNGYHKIYFPVCTSGTVNSGVIWKSTTVYRNK